MAVAIIQKSRGSFLLVARKLDQAVGSGARYTQVALSRRHLPRLACKHRLDELQSRAAIRVILHPLHPFFSKRTDTLLGRIVPSCSILV